MRRIGRHAMIAAGGVLFALALYTLVGAPGCKRCGDDIWRLVTRV